MKITFIVNYYYLVSKSPVLFFQLHSIDDQIAHTEETIKVAENDAKNADTEVRKAKCEMEKVRCLLSFFSK